MFLCLTLRVFCLLDSLVSTVLSTQFQYDFIPLMLVLLWAGATAIPSLLFAEYRGTIHRLWIDVPLREVGRDSALHGARSAFVPHQKRSALIGLALREHIQVHLVVPFPESHFLAEVCRNSGIIFGFRHLRAGG
jgi:hypothetical protein